MKCSCGGPIFQFEPGPGGAKGVSYPQVCRLCGEMKIDGEVLHLPEGFKDKMAGVAEEAAKHASRVKQELMGDPESRIESYFSRVYRAGYLHGFFLALAYFKHHAREGRLVRLRFLWKILRRRIPRLSIEDSGFIAEFDALMSLGVKEETDAARTSDHG